MWSWGHFYFTYNEKAIDPPGECKPTSDMWRMLASEMGFDEPVFKMTDSELCAEYINWTDPKMGGVDMDYFKQHGYYKIDVGSADTRTPHAEGKFPTPSGKVDFLLHDAKNFVAGPFRAMYEGEQDGTPIDPLPGYVPVRESPSRPRPRQALSAQHHLAKEPRVPQLVLRQRAAQDQNPRRAVRDDLADRRGKPQHPRR